MALGRTAVAPIGSPPPSLAWTGGVVSAPVELVDGSAAAPGLTFSGDTDTGLYRPAIDTVGIATAGVGRWQVDASGHFTAITDNTYDIGASGANRPRNMYIAGTGTFGGAISTGGLAVTKSSTLAMTLTRSGATEGTVYHQFSNTADRWAVGCGIVTANAYEIYNNNLANVALSFAVATNAATFVDKVTATAFKTATGSDSIPNNTATTIFTMAQPGVYLGQAYVDANTAQMTFVAAASAAGTNSIATLASNAPTSGTQSMGLGGGTNENVQITQTSGSAQTYTWWYIRIG